MGYVLNGFSPSSSRFFLVASRARGGVMIWGLFVEREVQAGDYVWQYEQRQVLPCTRRSVSAILQRKTRLAVQYNPPYFALHKTVLIRLRCRILDWPARSLDLNPIENLWGMLVRKVYVNNRQFNDIDSLKEAIFHVWDTIALHPLRVLVYSMPRRYTAVLEKRGGPTKYCRSLFRPCE